MAAFAARAAAPTGAGIVICPDVRSLVPFFEELALRFAEAGVDAITFDYFCRTAGTGKRDADFDYQPQVQQTRYETVNMDISAAAGYLRSPDGGAVQRLYTVGFCFGGRISFLQATRPDLDPAGVIGFYGWPVGPHRTGMPAPADLVDRFGCPVLSLFAGADHGITAEAREAFDSALAGAGVPHTTVVYDGAPHSFFDRHAAAFADASADAWRRMLEFMGVPIGS